MTSKALVYRKVLHDVAHRPFLRFSLREKEHVPAKITYEKGPPVHQGHVKAFQARPNGRTRAACNLCLGQQAVALKTRNRRPQRPELQLAGLTLDTPLW